MGGVDALGKSKLDGKEEEIRIVKDSSSLKDIFAAIWAVPRTGKTTLAINLSCSNGGGRPPCGPH